MTLAAFIKTISGAWTSGSGNNGMGQGLTVAASTWYHVILANNNGTPDIYFDTSATGANRPSGISDTKVRRIGSFRTNASSQITTFSQFGDEFLWSVSVSDVNVSNLGATATLFPLTVPTGVQVWARIRTQMSNATANTGIIVTSPDESDQAVNTPVGQRTMQNPTASLTSGTQQSLDVRTNTSAQIRATASAGSSTFTVVTYGWRDRRGRDV
jgi:hypothetical protein